MAGKISCVVKNIYRCKKNDKQNNKTSFKTWRRTQPDTTRKPAEYSIFLLGWRGLGWDSQRVMAQIGRFEASQVSGTECDQSRHMHWTWCWIWHKLHIWYLPLVIPSSWTVIMQTNDLIQTSPRQWPSSLGLGVVHRMFAKAKKGTEPECCSWVACFWKYIQNSKLDAYLHWFMEF